MTTSGFVNFRICFLDV